MIQFDPETHRYTLNGRPLPSVTSILKPLGGYEGIPQHILDEAAAFGTAVHYATELLDADNLGDGLHEAIVPLVEQWKRFKEEHKVVILRSEMRVHHKVHLYAGTLDRIIRVGDKTILVDIKTTNIIMPSVSPQLSAYAQAFEAMGGDPIDECWAVQLPKDGSAYQIHRFQPKEGWPVFLALLTLRNYSIKHKLENQFV